MSIPADLTMPAPGAVPNDRVTHPRNDLMATAVAVVSLSVSDIPSGAADNPVRPASAVNRPEITRSPRSLATGAAVSPGFSGGHAGTRSHASTRSTRSGRVSFAAVNAAARRELPALLARWLPDGRVNGREYEARNPRRADRNSGSFRVNLHSGRWADFATDAGGGDPVSLAAYLFGLSQVEAGRRIAAMLGVA